MVETKELIELNNLVVFRINEALKFKDFVVIGLPGGRSISHITDILKNDSRIDWKRIHFFMVDERLVPINHEDSNYYLLDKIFFTELVRSGKLPKENIHPFYLLDHADYGLAEYDLEFRKYGSKFDIAFFGVGEDGHIGGLFPKMVNDRSSLFFILHNSPKPPKNRVTLSKENLLNSGLVILLFIGGSKKNAFEKFKDLNIKPENCPAKLALNSKETVVYFSFD